MGFRFDVTTLETLERDFSKARETMTQWDWEYGGYEALYTSQKKRLLKEKETRDEIYRKNKRAKK